MELPAPSSRPLREDLEEQKQENPPDALGEENIDFDENAQNIESYPPNAAQGE